MEVIEKAWPNDSSPSLECSVNPSAWSASNSFSIRAKSSSFGSFEGIRKSKLGIVSAIMGLNPFWRLHRNVRFTG
jgi:hypothetical protein